ncbi:hypothetical protein SELMODRAFT_443746 [Selaginella moellendorffii]|uniref:WW domain-containing protein n=1 Tax=Selaginella moellendorffii TaxID=88036 RepID=D8S417_SELML|nr:hypothetical protein SELMODRAFT_443746 [Selaginella moellendorffii]
MEPLLRRDSRVSERKEEERKGCGKREALFLREETQKKERRLETSNPSMELLHLNQHEFTDAGLSLAPPSSFCFQPIPSFVRTPTAAAATTEESSSSAGAEVINSSSKKRKIDDHRNAAAVNIPDRDLQLDVHGARNVNSWPMRDVSLHLSAQPLPKGWEQCLDLKAGEMYYFNKALGLRTRDDPRMGFDWSSGNSSHSLAATKDMASLLEMNNTYRMALAQLQQQRYRYHQVVQRHLDLSRNLSCTCASCSWKRQFGRNLHDASGAMVQRKRG